MRAEIDVDPHVIAIYISSDGVPKRPLDVGTVTEAGLEGDIHAHAKSSNLYDVSVLTRCQFLQAAKCLTFRDSLRRHQDSLSIIEQLAICYGLLRVSRSVQQGSKLLESLHGTINRRREFIMLKWFREIGEDCLS